MEKVGLIDSYRRAFGLLGDEGFKGKSVLMSNMVANYGLFALFMIGYMIFYFAGVFGYIVLSMLALYGVMAGGGVWVLVLVAVIVAVYLTALIAFIMGIGAFQKMSDLLTVKGMALGVLGKKLSFSWLFLEIKKRWREFLGRSVGLALYNIFLYGLVYVVFMAILIIGIVIMIALEPSGDMPWIFILFMYAGSFLLFFMLTASFGLIILVMDLTVMGIGAYGKGVWPSIISTWGILFRHGRGSLYYLAGFVPLALVSGFTNNSIAPLIFTFSKIYLFANRDLFGFREESKRSRGAFFNRVR